MAQERVKKNFEGRRIKCQLLRRDRTNAFRPAYTLALRLAPPRLGVVVTASDRQRPSHNLPLEMVRAGWGRRVCAEGSRVRQ
jgi:hypothetical protein